MPFDIKDGCAMILLGLEGTRAEETDERRATAVPTRQRSLPLE
jgi:hypothetical protein